uniref:Uncharacterized protein n=1 Tax=Anopheles culicifacies TaxID=139723 RepID=A0A182MEQ1_9DIPT
MYDAQSLVILEQEITQKVNGNNHGYQCPAWNGPFPSTPLSSSPPSSSPLPVLSFLVAAVSGDAHAGHCLNRLPAPHPVPVAAYPSDCRADDADDSFRRAYRHGHLRPDPDRDRRPLRRQHSRSLLMTGHRLSTSRVWNLFKLFWLPAAAAGTADPVAPFGGLLPELAFEGLEAISELCDVRDELRENCDREARCDMYIGWLRCAGELDMKPSLPGEVERLGQSERELSDTLRDRQLLWFEHSDIRRWRPL